MESIQNNYPPGVTNGDFDEVETPPCKDCKHFHMCDCGDHGWCDELLEFTQPDDSCEWGEL